MLTLTKYQKFDDVKTGYRKTQHSHQPQPTLSTPDEQASAGRSSDLQSGERKKGEASILPLQHPLHLHPAVLPRSWTIPTSRTALNEVQDPCEEILVPCPPVWGQETT